MPIDGRSSIKDRWDRLVANPWAPGVLCAVSGGLWLLGSMIMDGREKAQLRISQTPRTQVPLRIRGRLDGEKLAGATLTVHFPTYPLDVYFDSQKLQLGSNGEFSLECPAFLDVKGAKALPLWLIARTPDGREAERKDLIAQGDPLACEAGTLPLGKAAPPPVAASPTAIRAISPEERQRQLQQVNELYQQSLRMRTQRRRSR